VKAEIKTGFEIVSLKTGENNNCTQRRKDCNRFEN
jgi:hypothetical protein